ncbi:hypothetical protein KEM56_001351 [Ascosphaera pollenicola]|nr:hypothetical protein KEM56_001351 [Ascosphaera pollenicola]
MAVDIDFLRDHDNIDDYKIKNYPTEHHFCNCKPACLKWKVGDVLEFFLTSESTVPRSSSVLLKIENIPDRWTNSVGFTVQVLDKAELSNRWKSSIAFLKLFDRRFAFKTRNHTQMTRWSQHLEHDLHSCILDMIESKKRKPSILNWGKKRNEQRDWSIYTLEKAFASHQVTDFSNEIRAYKALSSLQGIHIPQVFSEGYIDLCPPDVRRAGPHGRDREVYITPGILMEYIPGERLSEFEETTPNEAWAVLFEKATMIAQRVEACSVIRRSLHPKNFLFLHTGEGYGPDDYRVFMIDFKRSMIKRESAPEAWEEQKWKQRWIVNFWRESVERYQQIKQISDATAEMPDLARKN